jgi:hypothetical protein
MSQNSKNALATQRACHLGKARMLVIKVGSAVISGPDGLDLSSMPTLPRKFPPCAIPARIPAPEGGPFLLLPARLRQGAPALRPAVKNLKNTAWPRNRPRLLLARVF